MKEFLTSSFLHIHFFFMLTLTFVLDLQGEASGGVLGAEGEHQSEASRVCLQEGVSQIP